MTVSVAATQMKCSWDKEENVENAESLVRDAAAAGADIILLQELFRTPYFPKKNVAEYFELARPADDNPLLNRFSALADELDVVLPISFFERQNNAKYNSIAIFDADGSRLGVYRKSHIPDAPGYEEKYYFNPGDSGFKVWDTAHAKIGVGICWDQWFPEAARAMALKGAEILFYPTAIGTEVKHPEWSSKHPWQRCMMGHAVANTMPVVASNRVGTEQEGDLETTFYGSSFIADEYGEIVTEASEDAREFVTAELDLPAIRNRRDEWSLFRDRRPDLYEDLLTLDGGQEA